MSFLTSRAVNAYDLAETNATRVGRPLARLGRGRSVHIGAPRGPSMSVTVDNLARATSSTVAT